MGRLTTGTQDPQEPTAEQMLAAELEHVTRVAGFRAPSEYDRVGYRRDGTVEVYDRLYGPRARMIAAYHPDRPGVPDYAAAARYNAGRREAEDYYRRVAPAPPQPQPQLATVIALKPHTPRTRQRGAGRPRAHATRSSAASGDSPEDGESGEPPPPRARGGTYGFALSRCATCGAELLFHGRLGCPAGCTRGGDAV